MNYVRHRKNRGSLEVRQIHNGNRYRQNHRLRNENEHRQYQADSCIYRGEREKVMSTGEEKSS